MLGGGNQNETKHIFPFFFGGGVLTFGILVGVCLIWPLLVSKFQLGLNLLELNLPLRFMLLGSLDRFVCVVVPVCGACFCSCVCVCVCVAVLFFLFTCCLPTRGHIHGLVLNFGEG